MDLSELFKTGFQNLHKHTLEKNYQQKTLKNRMDDFMEEKKNAKPIFKVQITEQLEFFRYEKLRLTHCHIEQVFQNPQQRRVQPKRT
ncbi:hypothetical protein JTB14_015341 [Gonioctena quinquepunctata]|nr:hypothetical protein JTB14_015341 [Gonioctena quinquepunctata]